MSEFNINVQGGSSVRLPTAGKYCEKDIIVNASGGGGTEEFVGIKLSDLTVEGYRLPQKADLTSIPYVPDSMITNSAERFANFFRNNSKNTNGGFWVQLKEVKLPKIYGFSASMFMYCVNLTTILGDFEDVMAIGTTSFSNCSSLVNVPYMPNLEVLGNQSFAYCTGLTSFKFYKKLTTAQSNAFNGCTNLKDIYVPWSEGEVDNAPWGATNATIHYNTTYDENHEPIIAEV